MARYPVFLRLSLQNFKQKNSIAVKFTSLIFALFKRISVEYT